MVVMHREVLYEYVTGWVHVDGVWSLGVGTIYLVPEQLSSRGCID